MVATFIPGPEGKRYLPITVEWKKTNRLITLALPSGVPEVPWNNVPNLQEMMTRIALHEFEENVGIGLQDIVPLGPPNGLWDQVRNGVASFYPFFGTVQEPVVRSMSKLDKPGSMRLVLFELADWLALIKSRSITPEFGIESCAVSTTMLALLELVKPPD